ncbi:hypothetical protein OG875_17825 [Streptomyces sp. NBC_01498]|uniref:hypothetical protein n=1 Tax=Streptomyces sp. NBC_01498 TaxID=2975870 RepID=UPI002E7B4701|nr:hypothetical protein [Streptomyces sp. NBC_01498]WTL26279.1 hypothetical protein OG875_17825 [Streptomyces sp. NBC_01498]
MALTTPPPTSMAETSTAETGWDASPASHDLDGHDPSVGRPEQRRGLPLREGYGRVPAPASAVIGVEGRRLRRRRRDGGGGACPSGAWAGLWKAARAEGWGTPRRSRP